MSKTRVLRLIDYLAFTALTAFLVLTVLRSGRANIQTDAIDYYAILQRLTHKSANPIVSNLHFVEQRSPGYPILSLLPYALLSTLIDPFVQTEEIVLPSNPLDPFRQPPTERLLLPPQPLLLRHIFFKNFYIQSQDSWFEWKIIGSMLMTSYAFLFIGLMFAVKSLALDHPSFVGASLAPLIVITSGVFMHNIVNTPAYATLTAFGLSSLFAYFFRQGFVEQKLLPQYLSGLFGGLLVLTRLETVVIATVVLVSLLIRRQFDFVKHYLLGALVSVFLLGIYNLLQFGNPLHMGILRGDINRFSLDWGYLYANLFHPQSGVVFWSPLVLLGMLGLFLDDKPSNKLLAISSFALLALLLVRVPIMYTCVGQGTRLIGGLPVMCPKDMADALRLVRFDINRYLTVIIPFSVIGLRIFATWTVKRLQGQG